MTLEEVVAQAISEALMVLIRNGEVAEMVGAFDEIARLLGIDLEAIVKHAYAGT